MQQPCCCCAFGVLPGARLCVWSALLSIGASDRAGAVKRRARAPPSLLQRSGAARSQTLCLPFALAQAPQTTPRQPACGHGCHTSGTSGLLWIDGFNDLSERFKVVGQAGAGGFGQAVFCIGRADGLLHVIKLIQAGAGWRVPGCVGWGAS